MKLQLVPFEVATSGDSRCTDISLSCNLGQQPY
jgi:hypothetical protein